MNDFERSVSEKEALVKGADADGAYSAAAAPLDPCVDRLIRGEFDPTGHWALSRTKMEVDIGRIPNLSELLGGRLEEASQEARITLWEAVCGAVAVAYMYGSDLMGGKDAPIAKDRPPEKIWDAWAAHFLVAPYVSDLSDEDKLLLTQLSGDTVLSALDELGMLRNKRKFGARLARLGDIYASAGFALRLLQLEAYPDNAWNEIVPPPGSDHLQFNAY